MLLLSCAAACTPLRPRPPPNPLPPTPAPEVTPPAPAPAPARPTDQMLLSAPDAVPRPEPRARLGNPPFYEVYGTRYTILSSASGYVERGVASWYGADFHGARTAIGEPYDMYAMTAAHRTLPLPAYVRVTNLKNGRTVVVRLNDRGPFKANRIIDLSYTAALKLDMLRTGTTLVEVRSVEASGQPPAPSAAAATALYVQVGAFASESNAERLRQRLLRDGMSGTFVRRDPVRGQPLYRVRIGPIGSVEEYDRLMLRLNELGVADARLALD